MKNLVLCVFLLSISCVSARQEAESGHYFLGEKSGARLRLSEITDSTVRFKFSEGAKCQSSGIAVRDATFPDPEIDLDDAGLGYPSFEYFAGGDCVTNLRVKVSFEKTLAIGDRVVLRFSNCSVGNKKCDVISSDVLKQISDPEKIDR